MRPTQAASFDPGKAYRTIKTDHFAIHFDTQLEPVAQRVAVIVEEVHGILSPRYRWKPRGRTQMILTDNNDQANGVASVLPYNWLLIRVTAPAADSPLGTYDDWLRTLIMHEYTHILHMDQVGGVLRIPRFVVGKVVAPNGIQPGWVREGIATYEETKETTGGRGRASFSEMMLRTAALQKELPKIDQADGLGWRWPGSNSQYIYGEKFLQWLAEMYGEEKLLAYQRHIGRSLLFFMNNRHAKKVWGKSFYTLWKEWQVALQQQYAVEQERIAAQGVTELRPLSSVEASLSAPVLSPDGTQLAYTAAGYHRHPEIRLRDLGTGAERVLRKKQAASQISFSPTGDRIVYSAAGAYKDFNFFNDLYLVDLASGKLTRLTVGQRAFDPDFSPDGKKLVYVVNDAGNQHLSSYDFSTRLTTLIPVEAPKFTQYAQPRWSPDGKWIAVSSWREGGYRDLYLVRPDGTLAKRVTSDRALDLSPTWSRNGRALFFTSDRSGVSNVYRYDLQGGKVAQVTNVLTGVFEPTVAPDGRSLIVQHYNGKGYDLRVVDLTRSSHIAERVAARRARGTWGTSGADPASVGGPPSPPAAAPLPAAMDRTVVASDAGDGGQRAANGVQWTPANACCVSLPVSELARRQDPPPLSRKYSPFTGSLFLPRFISPTVVALDNGVLLSALTGGSDPLRWHNWLAAGTYRTDANYFGYFGTYFYNRFKPVFDISVNNYAVNFGPFGKATGPFQMFEKRLRGSVGVGFPIKRHRFGLQYFIEDRDNIPALTAAERAFFNLDRFAGFSATYWIGSGDRFPASISLEDGRKLRMNFTMTDKLLGSNEPNEQQIFSGDYREYIDLPWRHHVLATRLAGGIAWGDQLVQGTFGLGGSLGEGTLAGGESFFYFPLRGLPVSALSRTRALLASLEYRIPLASPQRGLGTWPVFLNNLHAAFFADYGNAWNAGESTGTWQLGNFFLGTGAELRGDFIIGHGLPITGRLGYGVIALNRDRLGTLVDPVFKNAIKYGTVIMQLGTSF